MQVSLILAIPYTAVYAIYIQTLILYLDSDSDGYITIPDIDFASILEKVIEDDFKK